MGNMMFEEICGVCHYFKFHDNEMIWPHKILSSLSELFKINMLAVKMDIPI